MPDTVRGTLGTLEYCVASAVRATERVKMCRNGPCSNRGKDKKTVCNTSFPIENLSAHWFGRHLSDPNLSSLSSSVSFTQNLFGLFYPCSPPQVGSPVGAGSTVGSQVLGMFWKGLQALT